MRPLKVVFLVGADSTATLLSIEAVCKLHPAVIPLAILRDTLRPNLATRIRNLRRNLRREGLSYLPARLVAAIQQLTESAVERSYPAERGLQTLRKGFPDRCFDLNDLSGKYAVPLVAVGSLNSELARTTLAGFGADLGIVIGTRILKRSTFGVPRLGSINLHKGAVPDYRGMPPGFWELYYGERQAGVTVHFVDDTLDTGDIVAESSLDILPLDTPDTLRTKLDIEGAKTLTAAITAVQSGEVPRTVQSQKTANRPNSRPTRREIAELRQRLPHWNVLSPWSSIMKNAIVLAVYHSGIFCLVRRLHKRQRTRGAIVLYHRVNDVSKDGVTTSLKRFASHMDMLSRWYKPVTSSEMVGRLREKRDLPGTSVSVHFDDCYRDIYLNAFPIMQAAGVPGTAFISTGFVDTDRVFAHDAKRSPFRFANLTREDLKVMVASGFEMGAHTINHVDLGTCPREAAEAEIKGSVAELERLTGRRVSLFSFPFGRPTNTHGEVRDAVAAAGCTCMFSAFGGIVDSSTDLFDIPRFGASDLHSPVHLALEIEGISPALLIRRLRGTYR